MPVFNQEVLQIILFSRVER